jgi:MFS family permease
MLGLGLGSLAGGALSARAGNRVLPLFAGFELGIGLYGFFSLDLIAAVAARTLDLSRLATGLVAFLLVLVPTMLMGATLPLLVEYATRRSGNVGRSVGVLYFVNTLGAALGSFAAVGFIMGALGQSGTTRSAALLNVLLAAGVLALHRATRVREEP